MNSPDPEADVDVIMKEVDINRSGAIDYTGKYTEMLRYLMTLFLEFVIATINRQNLLKKERLEAAFKLFDKVCKSIYFR